MVKNMLTYSVKHGGDKDRLHIAELRVQCTLAKHAYEELVQYSLSVDKNTRSRLTYGNAPVALIGHCVGFLSAVAVISKVLFPAERHARNRGERLRARLSITDLPEVRSRSVRNAFEHVDEKIDRLSVPESDDRIFLMDTNEGGSDGPIVLKRFDPASRTIQFLGETIDVEACYAEVLTVKNAL